jgi:hypothetical protein
MSRFSGKSTPPCSQEKADHDWRDVLSSSGGKKASGSMKSFPPSAPVPLIKCLVWFDINKEADWRISSSPESEAAFIRMAKDPYFNP